MKKIVFMFLAFMVSSEVYGTNRFLINANNITTGKLANELHNPSSVTLQGNEVNLSTVAGGVQIIHDQFYSYTSTADALAIKGLNFGTTNNTRIDELQADLSTHSVRIDELQADLSTTAVDIDDLYAGVNSTRTAFANYTSTADLKYGTFISTVNLHIGNTNYLELSGSTQTKTGGINFSGSLVVGSTLTVLENAVINGDLGFQTTYFFPLAFPFAVGIATSAVTVSSDAMSGLAFLSGTDSTPSLNTCFYKVIIPENFVTGTTLTLTSLGSITTGYADQQESWVLSFATGAGRALVISTGTGAPSLSFSSSVVVNVTGVTSVNGGERQNKTNISLPGVGMMVGAGDCALYVRAVRDGNSANDAMDSRSALSYITLAGKFQQ